MEQHPIHSEIECWFLDVGQGTSNVILLGEKKAIVIDCGPRISNVPLQLLKRYVDTIEALIISHNDNDHDGGVAEIIQNYPKSISNIYFLQDRPANQIKTWMLAKHELEVGNLLNPPKRLEVANEPQIIYSAPKSNIELRLLYPSYSGILDSEESGERRPNRSSGILCLFCGVRSVVFSGDSTIEGWECVAERLSTYLPLSCDIISVPHHGGYISATSSQEGQALRRLYSEIIKPKIAIISVGSSNPFGHPSPLMISTLKGINASILCTQITPKCSDDLESIRPGIIIPSSPSRSTDQKSQTKSRHLSRDVGCAGSIVCEISPDELRISSWESHQQAIIDRLDSATFHPLCKDN
jgi:beta-lactamase superfamily II metal-dependent hydrolase